ncbi:MAG TPA: efflux RND transporter permease subunit [Deltaproteobacteria bacterium]|nr:efflux RND transporter permease subunit [Deltaproteobacteria bacterium]
MKGMIAWFARNHVAANLLMATMAVGGLVSLPNIQQKTFPDIDINVIAIGVTYLGAAPEEVESGVCVRIEEEINGLNGIKKITSSAAEGACGVSAELMDGYPVDRALSEIKNAVDSITTFPAETEKPIVSHVEIKRTILQIAVSADASEKALKVFGERLRDAIASLPDITQVELKNARDYEISIEVPEAALQRFGLTFDEVVAAVRRGSLDRPGGSIKTSGGEILLRTKGQAYTGRDFEEIVLRTDADGTRLLLSDVANIVDGFDEEDRYAFFDGNPAVSIKVFRVGDQKVLDLVDTVRAELDALRSRLPEGLSLTVWQNAARTLRDRLDILIKNGIGGFVLVFIVLALFLRTRLAIWVSLGVPLSILGALFVFPISGISINVISLFAFIMVLGLLVDDAVVVGENVHRHQEGAEDPLEASIIGAQEVAIPVIFGVLTTIAAFGPMIFAPGTMGQIFSVIGLSAVLCLLFSVVESQLVLPAHLGHMKWDEPADIERQSRLRASWKRLQARTSAGLSRFAHERYRPLLDRALAARYAIIAAGVGILVVSLATVILGIGSAKMNFSFFPPIESDYVTASLVMPQGTPVEETEHSARLLLDAARRMKAGLDEEGFLVEGESLVKHILFSVGEQPMSGGGGPGDTAGASGSHVAEVSIAIQSGDDRPISAAEIKRRWRSLTPPIPGAVELTFSADLFSAGDPIDIQLRSNDVDQLRDAADRLKTRLAEYPGVSDINDSFREGKKEIKLDILPAAQSLGLTLDDLSRQVRQAFYGEEAQRIQRGRDDVRVMIRYPREARRSLADLENLRIRTPGGGEVPFYAVAKAELGRGYATIKRSNRQRVIDVTADVDAKQIAAGDIITDLEKEFIPLLTADYPGLTYSLEGEQAEQAESMLGLFRNYLVALLAIYALLAIPLRSYIQPLIIMAVIPFGLVGAIFGHWFMYFAREIFTDQTFNFSMMSIFGFVALTGVVVNSSLVLVHYINERRAKGVALEQAVREAGVARFRPIVLTSITTFVGLVPILREGSVSAQFLIPMATSLGFGVIFGSTISLFLVPSSYLVIEDAKARLSRVKAGTPRQDPARNEIEPLPLRRRG